jgi:MFS family permease
VILRTRTVGSVFRAAFGNPMLRRVGCAYWLFGTAELGIWIALLIFAYGHGGARATTLMVLVQLIPCILLGPFLGAVADRRAPGRVLCASYGLQAVSMAAVAAAMGFGAPAGVVFALAPLTTLAITITRPAQAALLPAIVATPDQLTAANVMSGWSYGAAGLAGPAIVGILVAWHGPGLAVMATAVMTAMATVLVIGAGGPAGGVAHAGSDTTEDRSRIGPTPGRRVLGSINATLRLTIGATTGNPAIRLLLILHTYYFALIGAAEVLCVILATSYLHMGPGGAGFLSAALGAGALLAGFATAFLVGRRHLTRTLVTSLGLAVVALALVDTIPRVAPVMLLMGIAGLTGAIFDVTGRTLLQRAAPSDAIASAFSILEMLMNLGLVLGAVLVQIAMGIGGLRAALFAPAVVGLLLLGGLWRKLQGIDSSATVPQVEIRLLRTLPIFTALPAPTLEGVARELEPMSVSAGTMVIKEGESGDRYYAIASGELAVFRQGRFLQNLSRGDGFGEIALIRAVPRQASVTAVTDASLFALRQDLFIETVTGHHAASSAAGTIIAGHLGVDGVEQPTVHRG